MCEFYLYCYLYIHDYTVHRDTIELWQDPFYGNRPLFDLRGEGYYTYPLTDAQLEGTN